VMPDPHWLLWSIGIAPECQGQGLGSALLQPMLARLDADGTPCFLETANEPNVPFYQRRGFRVVDVSTIAGSACQIWTMRRN
jgi:ribosomal protein S18 acetylase RimI-like enzyme